jgi:anthranilate synthase component II
MRILVLDNYDSFVYNLVHILRALGQTPEVFRNDKISLESVAQYDKILLSPGPSLPSEAGIMIPIIQQYAPSKSILGICLGHQAIGETFGATLKNLDNVWHGIASENRVTEPNDPVFKDIPNKFKIAHYHSWVVERNSIHAPLKIIAENNLGEVMGIRHQEYRVVGLQFHPESIMTEYGTQMIQNWVEDEGLANPN